MDIHVCKQCNSRFMYCRSCVFKPIYYKDLGFCSKECYNKSKEVIQEKDVEVIKIEEDISTSIEDEVEYPYFFTSLEKSIIQQTEENKENENQQNNGTTF